MSRFHRAELAAAVPWHVLPAEDLARGAELKVVDERTVAVRPLPAARSHSEVHLVFADAGRLRERRVVEMPAGKVVLRQTFDGQGTVSTDSPSSNLPAATLKLDVGPTRAPNLKPDLKELVVVPMPLRTREHLYSRLKPGTQSTLASLDADTAISLIAAESLQHNCDKALQIFGERFHCRKDRRPGFYTLLLSGQNWSASAQSMANPQSPGQFPYTAPVTTHYPVAPPLTPSSLPMQPAVMPPHMPMMPAPLASPVPMPPAMSMMQPSIGPAPTPAGPPPTMRPQILLPPQPPAPQQPQAYPGPHYQPTYTLTPNHIKIDTPYRWGTIETKFNIEAEHPNSLLARYLAVINRSAKEPARKEFWKLPVAQLGFVAQLAEFRPLYQSADEKQLDPALAFIRKATSPLQAWILLDRLQRAAGSPLSQAKIHRACRRDSEVLWRRRLDRFIGWPGLRHTLRMGPDRRALCELHAEVLKSGILPPLDARFSKALNSEPAEGSLASLTARTPARILEGKNQPAGVLFAWQLWQLEEKTLAAHVLHTTLKSALANKSLMLNAVDYPSRTGQWGLADEPMQKVLADRPAGPITEAAAADDLLRRCQARPVGPWRRNWPRRRRPPRQEL